MAWGNARRRVNVFLGLFLAVLAIDAFRPISGAHQWLKDELNYPLVKTGLWQGPWRLFGPDVDRVNLRLAAVITFADDTTASWESPDWPQLSWVNKFVNARHMNYFANILKAGQEPAWDGLAAYLARTTPHPGGGTVPVRSVVLNLRGALIPELVEGDLLPVAPYEAWDPPQPILTWKPAP